MNSSQFEDSAIRTRHYPAVGGTKNAVAAITDAEVVGNLQVHVVEFRSFLAWLEPNGSSCSRPPPSAPLVRRLVDMATTAEERLGFFDEARDGW